MLTHSVFLVCCVVTTCYGYFKLEAESSPSVPFSDVLWKQQASNKHSIVLRDREIIRYELCVVSPFKLSIYEFKYASHTEAGVLNIMIDDQTAWKFNTRSSVSNNMSFISVRTDFDGILLVEGRYILSFEYLSKAHSNWLELDLITLHNPMGFIPGDLLCGIENKTVSIEVEKFSSLGGEDFYTMMRSNASDEKTVLLKEGEIVRHNFCLKYKTIFTLHDVVYANDGPSDAITVAIDNQPFDMFYTSPLSDGGLEWNNFKSSGMLGKTIILQPGPHNIDLSVENSDTHGVELDYILFTLGTNSNSSTPIRCPSDVVFEAEGFVGGKLSNNSNASGNFSVQLTKGHTLHKEFCLRSQTDVIFDKLVYISRGRATLTFQIDNETIARVSDNDYHISSHIDSNNYIQVPFAKIPLEAGKHSLDIHADDTDEQGIDIDFINLEFNSTHMYPTNGECLQTKELVLEAEDFRHGETRGFRYRSNASGLKNIYMKEGDRITRSVCVKGRMKVLIKNVLLSNDGDEDVISVNFQPVNMMYVSTPKHTNFGKQWNFIQNKVTNSQIYLQTGKYDIAVNAIKTDFYGLEVDALILEITFFDPSAEFSLC